LLSPSPRRLSTLAPARRRQRGRLPPRGLPAATPAPQVCIDKEEALYAEYEKRPGGWRGLKDFTVTEIADVATGIKSFKRESSREEPRGAERSREEPRGAERSQHQERQA